MHFAVRARARSKCVLAARRPAAQAAKRQNRCLGPLAISTIIGMRLRRETYLVYGIANVLASHAPESNALPVGRGAGSQPRQKAFAAAGRPRAEQGQSARGARHCGAGLLQLNWFAAKFFAAGF